MLLKVENNVNVHALCRFLDEQTETPIVEDEDEDCEVNPNER